MRWLAPQRGPRRPIVPVSALAAAVCLASAGGPGGLAAAGAVAKRHFACTGPKSATTPCHFSTPSGNVRCLWTPHPNRVACELVSSGRGFRLRPTGRARAVTLKLTRRGQTLPTNQQLVFPQSMSCHDTSTTMTCNQDFGSGSFRIAPSGSRGT